MDSYSESALIERPTLALFAELGWETIDVFGETFGPNGSLGRETAGEVVLLPRLRAALQRLNPDLPSDALDDAVEKITRDRSALSRVHANREVYRLLKDGVAVAVRAPDGDERIKRVRAIDWNEPANNDFLLASQFWVQGEFYKRRVDLVGFVNGLPLVFVELKAAHKRLEDAYKDNLQDYKTAISQLFWYNALILLSNGGRSRVGSLTADWGHFGEWKRIGSERETGAISLETLVRGTCEPARLLDLLENFTLFSEGRDGLVKVLAKNHQYLGVNNAVDALRRIDENRGRLGVFWHTQGSGKSFSMIFFAQKVLRKLSGNFTFLIVTDRQELDDQIYKTFASTRATTEPQVQAKSGEHLKTLLREDHRYVFTLIQKFRTERGGTYAALSNRRDVIVITDEAHRSQYDLFAFNLRNALPNAAFIGFTGTPLMAGEEKTREVFGDYVSIYNFAQSVQDGATVPLYYENRIPELQLTNEDLNDDLDRLIEDASLDEEQERRLEREFARQYHLITRDDRLQKIAEDLADHFLGRGFCGKAMVVSIDKATAVRTYDKVRAVWQLRLEGLRADLRACRDEGDRHALADRVRYLEETDIAVVVSQGQNEMQEFQQKGLDILPHRKRMVEEDLETKFKNPDDPLRLVFVCAMWMTGFDVPCCSTIYLDKPMRNHTLMQTIARANRVFGEKVNGLIVDYVGVFRDLQKALAIYGTGPGGGAGGGECPVQDKNVLRAQLKEAMRAAQDFLRKRGVLLRDIQAAEGYRRVRLLEDAVEALLISDDARSRYLALASAVDRLFRAILPDAAANETSAARAAIVILAERLRATAARPDISSMMQDVEALLDHSIAAEAYVIREHAAGEPLDLSQVNFEALKARFDAGKQRTAAELLRNAITIKLRQMVRLNRTRLDYLDKLHDMIDDYNTGSHNVEQFFAQLTALAQQLDGEEKRHVQEQLSEEEMALFDLLTKPDMRLSPSEERDVKRCARELLETLAREKLVLDWRKRQQARADVRVAINTILDQGLPRVYTPAVYERKCSLVFEHVYESYYGQGRSVYAPGGPA